MRERFPSLSEFAYQIYAAQFFGGRTKVTKLRMAGGAVIVALFLGMPAAGQAQKTEASPALVDPATIPMPDLAFTPNAGHERDYDKYFYFHRPETDFATAYGDLQECDNYARGLPRRGLPYADAPYPYQGTMAGAVGGALGNAIAGAIANASFSAERRRQRRVIMRTCMRFKGYQAFGLPKSLWENFNFEEGNRRVEEDERQRLLRLQARVASGPRPTIGELRP